MTPCLTPDELVDLIDGTLPAARLAHVAGCRRCRDQADEVAATLAEIAPLDVPEPSPHFWTALNRRVRAAIADEPATTGWRTWVEWRTLGPLTGVALVLAALAVALDRQAPATPAAIVAAPAASDDALALVMALADTLPGPDGDGDAFALSPLPDLGDVAAATLTPDELQALEALLREAVDRPKS